ncbi:MAG: hypothetical protein ACE5DX_03215 [Candidatus Dojkabacteria bacterium]
MQRRNIYLFLGFFVLLLVSGVGFLAINQREVSVDDVSVESEKKNEEKEVKEEAEGDGVEVEVVPLAKGIPPTILRTEGITLSEYVSEISTRLTEKDFEDILIKESKKMKQVPNGWNRCEILSLRLTFYVPAPGDCNVREELLFNSFGAIKLPGKVTGGIGDIPADATVKIIEQEDTLSVNRPLSASGSITDFRNLKIGGREANTYLVATEGVLRVYEIKIATNKVLAMSILLKVRDPESNTTFEKDAETVLDTILSTFEHGA